MKKTILSLSLLLAVVFMAGTANAQLSVGVSIRVAPPAIPVYEQPLCPADGYLWIPGYWAYGDEGYYWVPGYWEEPPETGYLWTPGYWGYAGGIYGWNAGYWGPHVGFYGGVNYGFGYGGHGYYGGEWQGGHFRYNTAVTRVNTTVIHNTYVNRTFVNSNSRVSYNGGPGGVAARPTAQEESARSEHHVERTTAQVQHQLAASRDRNQFAAVNHGRPGNLAVTRPMTANRPVQSQAHVQQHVNRVQPAVNRAQPAENRAQPTMNRPQPQAHVQQQHSVNHVQPQVVHAAPHGGGGAPQVVHTAPHGGGGAPHGGAPHGGGGAPHGGAPHGGGEGGERHHR